MNSIEFKHFQDDNWRVEHAYREFAWFHKKNGREDEFFRMDVHFNDKKEKMNLHIHAMSSSKLFQKEWMDVVQRIIETVPKEINVVVTKSTPTKDAWLTPTNFTYMWVPILLFNLILYLLTLKYVPKGETVSVLFLVFSIPFGYVMSSTHHWGAGAPFAGFEKMIKVMRWKYALINLFLSSVALTIIAISLNEFN